MPQAQAQAQVVSYREWYREGPLGFAPQAHRTIWLQPPWTVPVAAQRSPIAAADRVIALGPIHIINISPPAGAVVEPPVPEYSFNLLLRTPALLRVGYNREPRWLAVSPGAMLAAPPDTCCEFVGEGGAHVLAITIHKAQVEAFLEDAGLRIDVRSEEPFRDPQMERQLLRLWHAAADEGPAIRLFADQVMRSMLTAFARRTGGRGPSDARQVREQLTNHTIRRLRDFVESSLADDLDVPMMASVASLSPAHFARAFTATVGMTPFRYVMSRRLARARELLERTQRSTLDIALEVGFKTPSHFTSRFRQEFGVTPRAIRPDVHRSDIILEASPGGLHA